MSLSDKITIVGIIIGSSGLTIKGIIISIKTNKDKIKTIFNNPYIHTFLGLFILSILALIPWHKFHYGELPSTQRMVIVHDTPDILKREKRIESNSNSIYRTATKPEIAYMPIKRKNKSQSKKNDTITKNQTIISGGTDIHAITGNGNHDIINGNVEVKEPTLLSEAELQSLYNYTMKFYTGSNKKLTLTKCDYSNASNVFKQINDFFRKKGTPFYYIETAMMDSDAPIIDRIKVNPNTISGNEIDVLVGKF